MIYKQTKTFSPQIALAFRFILIHLRLFTWVLGAFMIMYLLFLTNGGLNVKIVKDPVNITAWDVDDQGFAQSQIKFPNMHFKSALILYSIGQGCDNVSKEDIYKALNLFRNRTTLEFSITSPKEAQIEFDCDYTKVPWSKNGFKGTEVGEAGIEELLPHWRYLEIKKAHVYLFEHDDCPPNVVGHELLHAFGFEHNDNPDSVMYPYLDCENQKFNTYFFDRLNYIYGEDRS